MNLRAGVLGLLLAGIGFWCVGLVAALLGHLSASNAWYAVSGGVSIASAVLGLATTRAARRSETKNLRI
jgi:hypothetical protein